MEARRPGAVRRRAKLALMFIFFSNKLGWVGSILVSIVLSLLLIGLFWIF